MKESPKNPKKIPRPKKKDPKTNPAKGQEKADESLAFKSLNVVY